MVKEAIVKSGFEAPLKVIFDCLLNPKFEQQHHSLEGNIDVTITDWIENDLAKKTSNETMQRICFFTLVEKSASTNIFIVENQECVMSERDIHLRTSFYPNSKEYGNIFFISSHWHFTEVDSDFCSLCIVITVECKKPVWGITDMAENMLCSKVQKLYEQWCSHALDELRVYRRPTPPVAHSNDDDLNHGEAKDEGGHYASDALAVNNMTGRPSNELLDVPLDLASHHQMKRKPKYSDSEDVSIDIDPIPPTAWNGRTPTSRSTRGLNFYVIALLTLLVLSSTSVFYMYSPLSSS